MSIESDLKKEGIEVQTKLDTLKSENIKATFFLLGSRVELDPDLVKREYDEGH